MDISSLLSPSEQPGDNEASSGQAKRPSLGRNPLSVAFERTPAQSPHPQEYRSTPPISPHNVGVQAQQQPLPSPAMTGSTNLSAHSTSSTPHLDRATSYTSVPRSTPSRSVTYRTPSTPGMDTLADLAAMQHHQQNRPTNASSLRNEVASPYEAQRSPSIYAMPNLPRTLSRDLAMSDLPTPTPPPRTYNAPSLSEEEVNTVTDLVAYLAENSYAYESHVRLINLLHRGFVAHVYDLDTGEKVRDPQQYPLLGDMKQAREAMDSRFSVGEDLWVDWLGDEMLLAKNIEERLTVMELCKRAVEEEMGSTALWKLYGDWVTYLYETSFDISQPQDPWVEEDKIIGREILNQDVAMAVWEQAIVATRYRINDSHLIWDRYVDLLLDDLARNFSMDKLRRLDTLFNDRLQTPHATRDDTMSRFSGFVTQYHNAEYEQTMADITNRSQNAKRAYDLRDFAELKVKRALQSGDQDAEWNAWAEYIEEEASRVKSHGGVNFELLNALYQRATLRFPSDAGLWQDYVELLIESRDRREPPLPVSERATRHCPWSGNLWSQQLLNSEVEGKDFAEIEGIKHKATKTGILDVGGMDELLKVYTAWCGFLRRRAFDQAATDDEVDVGEMGIRSSIEDVKEIGLKRYGRDFKGDPMYRVERIYIKFLTQSNNHEGARQVWSTLIKNNENSHDFWLRYYHWEMSIWSKINGLHSRGVEPHLKVPRPATEVLRQALARPNLDWPEKIIETFINHCEQHEAVQELQHAMILARKAEKLVSQKRSAEAAQAAAAASQAQYQQAADADSIAPDQLPLSATKRKMSDLDELEAVTAKRPRTTETNGMATSFPDVSSSTTSQVKRDRENATIIVKNLPSDVSDKAVRSLFRDCGKINSLKLVQEADQLTATATIEFESQEDIPTALTRDKKTVDGNEISVSVGTGTTLWVTNFPPAADEGFLRKLFEPYGDIVEMRFPSLAYNTHRRFCYVQYLTGDQARAACALDGTSIAGKEYGGTFNIVVKISDPSKKHDRAGPMYEGREVIIRNIPFDVTDDEIREIFATVGGVESVRIPRKLNGQSKGLAWVVFSSKDLAISALELNHTVLKKRALDISISEPQKTKISSKIIATSASPEPSSLRDGQSPAPSESAANGSSHASSNPKRRTIALLNLPDTLNDARLKAIVEPHGSIKKLVLRHDHQGAIVEFEHERDVGVARLALDGLEVAPGKQIRVGTVDELFRTGREKKDTKDRPIGGRKDKPNGKAEEAEKKSTGGMAAGKGFGFGGSGVVHRPGAPGGRRGGRGGLGVKRGGVGLSGRGAADGAGGEGMDVDTNRAEGVTGSAMAPKSNEDFRKMFAGGNQTVVEEKE